MEMPAQTNEERRIFERFSARFPVKFKDAREDYGSDVFLRDASAQGIRIMTKERFFLDDKPRFSFLPFGMGKRICSGHAMAMMEAVLAISRLCQRYQFSLPDNQPLKMQAMVTLHPVGNINLRVIKR